MNKLPASLMESLKNIKGFNKEAFEKIHSSGEQVTSIRYNPLKSNRLQSAIPNLQFPIPWCPYGYYLSERPSFTFDPLFHAGAYYVQEASSMFLWEVLKQTVGDKTAGNKVLDLCAAPGGKSTLLTSYFKDGLVVANDAIRSRAAILIENITKWGTPNTVVSNNDPKAFEKLEGYFDVMVIDAPCSGSGLFRRDPEAINEWSGENVQLCSQRQQRIIADAYPCLKNNGILIYSTCSYSKEEDEDILEWICNELNFEGIRLSLNDGWNIIETATESSKSFGYRFFPYNVKGEGFFIAAFRKKDGVENYQRTQQLPKASKDELAMVNTFIKSDEELFCFKQADNIVAIPAQWADDLALLQKHLYLRKAGITLGAPKGKDFIPSHELAMSTIISKGLLSVSLTKEQAIQFLQKKELQLGNLEKGWALTTYMGINIGWIKILHNRVNNYYPVEWRILKEKA